MELVFLSFSSSEAQPSGSLGTSLAEEPRKRCVLNLLAKQGVYDFKNNSAMLTKVGC